MKKFYLCLMCFAILFLAFMPHAVALDYPITVNYGKVQPDQTTALNRILPFSFNAEKADGLLVEIAGLTGANVRQSLPAKRMMLSVGDQSYQLTNLPLAIIFTERQKTARTLNFTLTLELLPSDLPDKYTGNLIIRPWSDTPQGKKWNNTVTAQLTVEVKPWIKLLCDTTVLNLETTYYSSRSMQNEQPLRIKIASNTQWMLYCQLNLAATELIPVFSVASIPSTGVQTFNGVTGFSNNRKSLAAGRTTTADGKYWCDLLLTVEIKNVMNYPAKEYLIPLHFGAEFLNDTTN
ncbi:MAG TPA: hypothetical protein VEC37_07100 [Bacillota bacterium]|nr:hypothetical protein [Bacillota bacterium]